MQTRVPDRPVVTFFQSLTHWTDKTVRDSDFFIPCMLQRTKFLSTYLGRRNASAKHHRIWPNISVTSPSVPSSLLPYREQTKVAHFSFSSVFITFLTTMTQYPAKSLKKEGWPWLTVPRHTVHHGGQRQRQKRPHCIMVSPGSQPMECWL